MEGNGLKLSVWAKTMGLTYRGAYRLFKAGQLPCRYTQLETGTVIVFPDNNEGDTVVYARVSSADQKEDLIRQKDRLLDYCSKQGWVVSNIVTEIGSGLNGYRKRLLSILKDKQITRIVVEHTDRLTRFGFEYILAALNAQSRSIVVINQTENKDDIVKDMMDVVTCLCARIYGKRSAKNKADKALKAIAE